MMKVIKNSKDYTSIFEKIRIKSLHQIYLLETHFFVDHFLPFLDQRISRNMESFFEMDEAIIISKC